MGEKIRTLARETLLDATFKIELNRGPSGGEEQVHIQSDRIRVEMDKADFIRYATAVLLAEERLRRLKHLK